MMHSPEFDATNLVSVDTHKEKDNVLILFPKRLVIATIPTVEANRLEHAADLAAAMNFPHWVIAVSQIAELKGSNGGLEVTYRDGDGDRNVLQHKVDQAKLPLFLEGIQEQAGGAWDRSVQRESGLAAFVGFLIIGLAIAGVTALLYFGIKSGWITRAPSVIVLIHDFLGVNGILIAGGVCILFCLLGALTAIFAPGQVVRLKR